MHIEVSQNYDLNNWHEDLRIFYFEPGAYAKHTTFLFTDTQIVTEEFLEDINNTLNSGVEMKKKTKKKTENEVFFIV